MSRIAIFGTGGMGRELADIIEASGKSDFVYVVDTPEGPVNGTQVISPAELRDDDRLVVALGSSTDRRAVVERFVGRAFATVISDSARVSRFATVGEGSVVCDFAVINSGAVVGRRFQANVYAQLSHDCLVGDFVTFAPHVSCNGWVEIGDEAYVGAGAVIRNGSPNKRLKIGGGAVIGMGAIVTGDVAPGDRSRRQPRRRDPLSGDDFDDPVLIGFAKVVIDRKAQNLFGRSGRDWQVWRRRSFEVAVHRQGRKQRIEITPREDAVGLELLVKSVARQPIFFGDEDREVGVVRLQPLGDGDHLDAVHGLERTAISRVHAAAPLARSFEVGD